MERDRKVPPMTARILRECEGKLEAVVYSRVSTKEQVDRGLSLSTQQEKCEEFCTRQGWTVAKTFIEEGESGRTRGRKKLIEMVEYCRKNQHRIAAIVSLRSDRLHRNLENYIALKRKMDGYGIQITFVDGQFDDSAIGKAMERIIAVIGELENDLNSERTKLNMQKARESGRIVFRAPLGLLNSRDDYGKPIVVRDEERVPFVIQAFELMGTGLHSEKKVREKLYAAGFRTKKGMKVARSTFSSLLRNEIYTGWLPQPDGKPSVPGKFPKLIDRELFDSVQEVLSGNKYLCTPHVRNNPDFPLRYFMRCGCCDTPLTASWSVGKKGKRYPYYRCPNPPCRAVNIRKEILEREFLDLLMRISLKRKVFGLLNEVVMDRWRERRRQANHEIEGLNRQLRELQDYEERLTRKWVDDRLPDRIYYSELTRLEKQTRECQVELSKRLDEEIDVQEILSGALSVLQNARSMWFEASIDQRQRLQKALFPDGLVYTPDRGIGTPVIGKVFNAIRLSEMSEDGLATPTGVEPVLPA